MSVKSETDIFMKVKRKIIQIAEELCDGCGNCIPACPEQAIQIVETKDGIKAQLVKEFYCDGLGACLGSCPTGALTIEEKESEAYNEEATVERIKEVAPEMLETHLKHMKEHTGALHDHQMNAVKKINSNKTIYELTNEDNEHKVDDVKRPSELRQWPVQLHLISPAAPYFQKSDVLLSADCVAFAVGDFHKDFLKGKSICIGCPKLDKDQETYVKKIQQLVEDAKINTLLVMIMEVPCCVKLLEITQQAMNNSNRKVPVKVVTVSIQGEILSDVWS